MKCFKCGKSAAVDGVTLYRVNEYEVTGIWACAKHIGETPAKPDEETLQIVSDLGGDLPEEDEEV